VSGDKIYPDGSNNIRQ